MDRIDLIIDALESCNESAARPFDPERVEEALAAARELKIWVTTGRGLYEQD